jgi:hypothetical protein
MVRGLGISPTILTLEIKMSDDVKLYNPHDGITGRDGGPYLDQEERRLAEIVRAAKEDREPDFENAPATAGTPLVTAAVLVATVNPASNPSQENADPVVLAVAKLLDDEDYNVSPFSVREKTDQEKENEKAANDASIHNNPSNSTIRSTDDGDDNGLRDVKQENDKTAPEDKDSVSSKVGAKATTTTSTPVNKNK